MLQFFAYKRRSIQSYDVSAIMILLFAGVLLHLPTGVVGAKAKVEKCVEMHERNEETGQCEWIGPKDACIQLLDHWNHSYFLTLPDFPKIQSRQVDLTGHPMDDYAIKVVVRKGCMFTGFAFKQDGNQWQEIKTGENLVYGAYSVPNYMNKERDAYWDGLTVPSCWCDPTEATVNGHVPSPPPNKKCIEHHEFDEDTQQCEWVHDSKYCAEIVTTDNRRMRLEIPGWPEKKKYDVNHYTTQYYNNFHVMVSNILVRQHCVATLVWRYFHEWKTMPTNGYGYHDVISYPKMANHATTGTARFICECIK